MPLCVLLGGSVGSVPSYNSNGLWLKAPDDVAADWPQTSSRPRSSRRRSRHHLRGKEGRRRWDEPQVDFNQGRELAEALQRCHAIDDLDLAWIEEPIVFMRIGGVTGLASLGCDLGCCGCTNVHPSLSRGRGPRHARNRDCALARMARLGWSNRSKAASSTFRTFPVLLWSGTKTQLRPPRRPLMGASARKGRITGPVTAKRASPSIRCLPGLVMRSPRTPRRRAPSRG